MARTEDFACKLQHGLRVIDGGRAFHHVFHHGAIMREATSLPPLIQVLAADAFPRAKKGQGTKGARTHDRRPGRRELVGY